MVAELYLNNGGLRGNSSGSNEREMELGFELKGQSGLERAQDDH